MCAPERVPAQVDSEQPPQLDDRLRVIVDTKVADAVDPLARLRAIAAQIGEERTAGAFVNFGADYLARGRIFVGGDTFGCCRAT